MRIIQAENIDPIHVGPGDYIQLTHREILTPSTFARMFGEKNEVKERVVMSQPFLEPRTIDRVAIVELDNGELETLGMSQGIAGVFGRQQEPTASRHTQILEQDVAGGDPWSREDLR